jgi:phosphatidylserine/phosphatidylglycerophosphate/cardiolipin synthase-like enzyme
VVIDGQVAFLGGLDLCDHRWDDRSHKDPNPLRLSRGTPHQPFHDVQAYVAGVEAAQHLTALFVSRWSAAGGDSLTLPPAATASPDQKPAGLVPLAASTIFLSRTDPRGSPTGTTDCREIYELYARAISSAERLIYIETQYFSSREVGAALVERLSKASASPLDVVIVLNMQGETPKEQIAVGLAQAKIIGSLREAAQHSGHRLGIYYTVPHTDGTQEPERATYIHSKIAIVDDRFLTVGSANLTNRSMSVDTELNLSVETANNDDALASSIARARQSLIAEHLGVESDPAQANLVATLDDLASRRQGRLRLHPSPTDEERAALEVIDPQQLPFDPAAVEDHDHRRSIFVGGLSALWKRLAGEGA